MLIIIVSPALQNLQIGVTRSLFVICCIVDVMIILINISMLTATPRGVLMTVLPIVLYLNWKKSSFYLPIWIDSFLTWLFYMLLAYRLHKSFTKDPKPFSS
jgi:hypothetical protein